MSYTVLARKYRPKSFKELKGQDALVRIIENSIISDRIHHAYLLMGIRGVGKTTTGRIISKSINCSTSLEDRDRASPCENCNNCKAISSGSHPDVLEFDAASNTGIEDIKIIIDNCQYEPIQAKFKVFIIDEVHMLSTKAFNALLKTLEEPPKNTLFIFATTEIRKIPITIISRCQKFYLRTLNSQEITDHLLDISKKENINLENSAAKIIALKSEGSVRDSLSLLDQAIANSILSQEEKSSQDATLNITHEAVSQMLNIVEQSRIHKLMQSICNGEAQSISEQVDELANLGIDEKSTISELMAFTGHLTKLKVNPNHIAQNIEKFEFWHQELKDSIESMTGQLSLPFIVRLWQVLAKGAEEITYIPDKRLALEMVLFKASFTAGLPTGTEIIDRLQNNKLNDILNTFNKSKISN